MARVRTIVKAWWQLPPSQAENPPLSTNIFQTENVALKSPKTSVIKGCFDPRRPTPSLTKPPFSIIRFFHFFFSRTPSLFLCFDQNMLFFACQKAKNIGSNEASAIFTPAEDLLAAGVQIRVGLESAEKYRVPRKGGVASRGFCTEAKAVKTMKIHRFIASPSSVLFCVETRRTLPDPELVSLAPAQRALS